MKLAIIIAPGVGIVDEEPWANGMHPAALPMDIADRARNGDGFTGETCVRLPRRFTRAWKRILGLTINGRVPTIDQLEIFIANRR